MNEPQTQAAEASAAETTDAARKTWVAPTFERTPLNEAMAGNGRTTIDAQYGFS